MALEVTNPWSPVLSISHHHENVRRLPETFTSGKLPTPRSDCLSCSNELSETSTRFAQGSMLTSFEHLLPAGTLTLSITCGTCICSLHRAKDAFQPLHNVHILRPFVAPQDIELFGALSFLCVHRFIVASYLLAQSTDRIVIRVYLIPYDLPGSHGVLRRRDEDRILKPARNHLRRLLSHLSRSRPSWEGEDVYCDKTVPKDAFLPLDTDQRSLFHIFNDLTTTHGEYNLSTIPHLRSSLYEYQKEGVAAMLAMEAANNIVDDPLYIPIVGMDDRSFYFQPTTMEVLIQRPRRYRARGGILCEELGTGKTVMILSLILETLDVLPDPPEEDGNEILTPLVLRHFPQDSINKLRETVMRKKQRRTISHRQMLPTLVEVLCDYVRRHPATSNLRAIEDVPIWNHVRKNAPFFFHIADIEYAAATASSRQRKSYPPRLTYLTTATLIVVPATLQTQWYSEILKHCSSAIRILVIKTRGDIPPTVSLASDYDIVLTTYNLISNEAGYSKCLLPLYSGYTCECPEFALARIPDCSCRPPGTISPLLQIRWKRLVRDEGHNAASRGTELNHLLHTISAERKWIITGTPTTNLLGLNFGSVTDDDPSLEEFAQDESAAISPAGGKDDILSQEQSSGSKNASTEHAEEPDFELLGPQSLSHRWSKSDRIDLYKLGSMLSDFLDVLPFAADQTSFTNLVVKGLMDENGPLPGTRLVLEQVMSTYMVRHRVEDIERHVRLPPLSEEIVLLDLEEYGQMTYNVLLSYVAVNAVDSERRDMDYLFHPSKAAALQSIIENLSHSLFWRFDENAFDYDLPDNIHRSENAVIHAQERGQPDEDILLVQRAIFHLRKALENKQFLDMQHGLEIPYHVRNAPSRVKQSWGLVHQPRCVVDNSLPFLIYPSFALELRETVMRQPLIKEDSLAARAELLRAKNSALAAFLEATKSRADRRSDSKSSSAKKRRRDEIQVDRARLDTARRTGTVDSKEKLQELHDEFRKAQERLKAEAMEDDFEHLVPNPSNSLHASRSASATGLSTARDQLLRSSPYTQIRIGNSTSSKLNYILEEIRNYSATEKFLIFSGQPFNLVHISEGLDLMGVKHLHFMKEASSTKGKGPQRDQWLTTFETSETYRVFLMELKYGARGLNIVSASRVIFCEPVWRADVESQAIKRVHRIGQTRPVTVKTLAIRSTFEEYMIQRRRDFKGSKLPGLTEEWGVRNYLQNPVFLETPSGNTVNLDFPLIHVPECGASDSEQDGERVDATNEQADSDQMGNMTAAGVGKSKRVEVPDLGESPTRKRRKVQFK